MGFEFDPYSYSAAENPFPDYKILRDEHPCYWSENGQAWCLSRYDDIVFAGKNWEIFSSAKGNSLNDSPQRAGRTVGTCDPPKHDHLRSLINMAFMRKNLGALIEPVREATRVRLSPLLTTGKIDFLWDVSVPVIAEALSSLIGIDKKDHKFIREATNHIITSNPNSSDDNPFAELFSYAKDLVASRKQQPEDDLVSLLLDVELNGEKLSDEEVQWSTLTMIAAGMESASSFVSLFIMNIASEDGVKAALLKDSSLIPKALEESLRYNTSAQRFRRTLTCDYEMHGQVMKAGDAVMLMYGSGNRDERKFDNPDRYDLNRNTSGHLGFGQGKHFCLGSQLARLLSTTIAEEVLAIAPTFSTKQNELEWLRTPTFRGMKYLPLTLK